MAGAEAAAEKTIHKPSTALERSETEIAGGVDDISNAAGQDTSAPHALLLGEVMNGYQADGSTLAKSATDGARKLAEIVNSFSGGAGSSLDGFELVDKPFEPADKPTDEMRTEVAALTPTVSPELVTQLPSILFGVEVNPESFLDDELEGDVELGLGRSYQGTFLRMNVRPINHEVKPGETIEHIARKHLGARATEEQVQAHVEEIVRANIKTMKGQDADSYVGKSGDFLRLPGHTADGGDLFKDHSGTIYKVTEDGKVRVTYLDGTGFERTPEPDGGVTKRYFGTKPEDNYTVKIAEDGFIESNDRVDPAHKPAEDLATETKRLTDLADKGLGIRSEREAFKRDMADFVKNATERGLPDSEIAQTFAEVSRILEAKGSPMTSRERARLAIGIVRGAAHPDSVNQGAHNTCSLTIVENRFYRREPSTNARVLADIATKGKFVAADGTVVKMKPSDLRAHGEGALNPERGENVRTYASQIFQVAAGNALHTRNNEGRVPPGDIRYAQVKPSGEDDTGERLLDYTKHPVVGDRKSAVGDVGTVSGINETAYLISGKDEANVFIASEHMIAHDSKKPESAGFKDAQELIDRLKEAKAEGKPLSVGIGVFTNAEPFYSLLKDNDATPFDGDPSPEAFAADLHAVTIVGFNEKDMTVQIDNQWGDDLDMISKPISVYELFKAANRVTPDTWLGRLDERWDGQSNDENAAQLKAVMGSNFMYWAIERESAGLPIDSREVTKTMEKYERLVSKLPPSLARDVRKTIDQYNRDWETVRKVWPAAKSPAPA